MPVATKEEVCLVNLIFSSILRSFHRDVPLKMEVLACMVTMGWLDCLGLVGLSWAHLGCLDFMAAKKALFAVKRRMGLPHARTRWTKSVASTWWRRGRFHGPPKGRTMGVCVLRDCNIVVSCCSPLNNNPKNGHLKKTDLCEALGSPPSSAYLLIEGGMVTGQPQALGALRWDTLASC